MFQSITGKPFRLFAHHLVLAAMLAVAGNGPALAQDKGTDLSRPSCKTCSEERKKLEESKAKIQRIRKQARETDTSDGDLRRLDKAVKQNRKTIKESGLKLEKCKNGCPASIRIKVKPISVKSCKACQKQADALAAVLTQIKQLEAEQKFLKDQGRKVSIQGKFNIADQLAKLKKEKKKRSKTLIDCEKKLCVGKGIKKTGIQDARKNTRGNN